jgi:PAS domain S-box-containing protein
VSTGGVQQLIRLAPAPDSARTARRFVSEVLQEARADHFIDTATLLTSELVTNGIVHAHTDLHMLVEATPRWVRVEVADGDPRLPARREYDANASTGRGLEMVELLADDFGMECLDDGGKRVWFRLGATPGRPDLHEHAQHIDLTAQTTTITLLGIPVTLYCAWQQHADALLREATLLAFDEEDPDSTGDYQLASRALGALADAASGLFELRDDKVMSADVPLDISTDALPWFPILRDLLSRATQKARAGQLLAPPTLPEIVTLRNWICDEVARQTAGLAPSRWKGDGDEAVPAPAVDLATVEEVRTATSAVVAADTTNRIVAVSASAEALLGWQPGELDGQRLVTIIPPRLRELHIAGFTRHLLEGTSHIIGTDVRVPAQCKDGSEVEVTLHIERRAGAAARGLFVATLTRAH